jgi:hypothetical protein
MSVYEFSYDESLVLKKLGYPQKGYTEFWRRTKSGFKLEYKNSKQPVVLAQPNLAVLLQWLPKSIKIDNDMFTLNISTIGEFGSAPFEATYLCHGNMLYFGKDKGIPVQFTGSHVEPLLYKMALILARFGYLGNEVIIS